MNRKRKHIPEHIKNEIIVRQEGCCAICMEKLITTADGIHLYQFDHIIPHCETQDNDIENLQALHLDCHFIKTVREARMRAIKEKKKIKRLKGSYTKSNVSNPFESFKFDPNDLV